MGAYKDFIKINPHSFLPQSNLRSKIQNTEQLPTMPFWNRGGESQEEPDDFDEYDPTPYGGGYDLHLTFGRPIPPSDETCYPVSADGDAVDYDRPTYNSGSDFGDRYGQSRPKPQPAYGFQPKPQYGGGGSEYGSGYGGESVYGSRYGKPKPEYESGYGGESEYGSGYSKPKPEYGSGYGGESEYGSGYSKPTPEYGSGYGGESEYGSGHSQPKPEYGSGYGGGESEFGSGYSRPKPDYGYGGESEYKKPSYGEEEEGGRYKGTEEFGGGESEYGSRYSRTKPEYGYGGESEYKKPSYGDKEEGARYRKSEESGYGGWRSNYDRQSYGGGDEEKSGYGHKKYVRFLPSFILSLIPLIPLQ